jgi:anthranilate/para-aminobenzoate synthase component I
VLIEWQSRLPLRIAPAARRAGHGARLHGEHWLLSCSPELFFTLEEGRLTTRR